MKNALFLCLLALLMSTLVWSCLKEQPLADFKVSENAIADDRTDEAEQGCNCQFQITSAPPNGFPFYWRISLEYDPMNTISEWITYTPGDSHNFYLSSSKCFEVEHYGYSPQSAFDLAWQVTCNGKSVSHTYNFPKGKFVADDKIQVCLDENCQPYLLLDE